jgi:hypothetical protein
MPDRGVDVALTNVVRRQLSYELNAPLDIFRRKSWSCIVTLGSSGAPKLRLVDFTHYAFEDREH